MGRGPGLRGIFAGVLDDPLRTAVRHRFPDFVEVSFEAQRAFLDLERRFDDGEFTEGGLWDGTPVFAFLLGHTAEHPAPRTLTAERLPAPLRELAEQVGLAPHFDRGLKYLSTGEFRKALWLRAAFAESQAILFEDPFEGLDQRSRRVFSDWTHGFDARRSLILVTGRPDEASSAFTEMLRVDGMDLTPTPRGMSPSVTAPVPEPPGAMPSLNLLHPAIQDPPAFPDAPLVAMRRVSVHFGERQVLSNLDFTVAPGQHTLIAGPNGSGKTTLVHLITGDCPQVFSNDVKLFGFQRGTGETIWEIKAHFGHVSQAVHLEFLRQPNVPVEQVLLSGFQDTLGLHREPIPDERAAVRSWLEWLGLSAQKARPWSALPDGEQRLLLTARAAIKPPRLLLLDELGQGLTRSMRARLLGFVNALAQAGRTTVLLVTHDPAEHLPCLRQRLDLGLQPATGGGIGRPDPVIPTWRLTAFP